MKAAIVLFASFASSFVLEAGEPRSLWEIARSKKDAHRFSTLFTAQDVRQHLSSEEGLGRAMEWCRKTGVTRVFVEAFRDGYQAEKGALENAKVRFLAGGIEVSGCVTPTRVGKSSTGWKDTISCYTDMPTQEKIQAIFEYTAGIFDEIMIDDFWFTDCACPECDAARKARTVTIGDRKYPVAGDTWSDYRLELMWRLSLDRVLGASKRVNPRARLIVKYPQWYDNFHERGYDVIRETKDFDLIWVGTETRDYDDRRWGGTVQYEAYFIMRWLGGIGGEKCGGGWFDPYGTTEKTYIEQARQTVLGGARESLLFCYGSLQNGTGPKNVDALRQQIPELLDVAGEVRRREIVGIAAYKPPSSAPEKEARVYDFVGMMGLPLVPCHEFPAAARAAFFPVHAAKDPDLPAKLQAFVDSGKPVLVTDGLAQRLEGQVQLAKPNVKILEVKGNPRSLLELSGDDLARIRAPLLDAFGASFRAPNRVALYLFRDGSWVAENFSDGAVQVEVNGKAHSIEGRSWIKEWK